MKDLEQLVMLLLGSAPGPIPSAEHLQKEAFVLTQVNPKLSSLLRFENHYRGPYSARLQEVSLDPLYYEQAYVVKADGKIEMTVKGKKQYEKMIGDGSEGEYDDIVIAASMVRDMYDRLTVDELLFLIYDTYPAYTSKSNVHDRYKDPDTRRRLATSLVKKDLITQGRFKELIANV